MPALILALEQVNQYILSVSAALLLLGAGLYFTIRFRAFYIRHPLRALRAMPLENGAGQMLLSLGGTVGVGNISGVALGILYGGAGAVFWMWVGALLSMALKYAEIILAMATRKSDKTGFRGGAPYYMKRSVWKSRGRLVCGALDFRQCGDGRRDSEQRDLRSGAVRFFAFPGGDRYFDFSCGGFGFLISS